MENRLPEDAVLDAEKRFRHNGLIIIAAVVILGIGGYLVGKWIVDEVVVNRQAHQAQIDDLKSQIDELKEDLAERDRLIGKLLTEDDFDERRTLVDSFNQSLDTAPGSTVSTTPAQAPRSTTTATNSVTTTTSANREQTGTTTTTRPTSPPTTTAPTTTARPLVSVPCVTLAPGRCLVD